MRQHQHAGAEPNPLRDRGDSAPRPHRLQQLRGRLLLHLAAGNPLPDRDVFEQVNLVVPDRFDGLGQFRDGVAPRVGLDAPVAIELATILITRPGYALGFRPAYWLRPL